MQEEQPAVIVKDLVKTFKLPHDQHSGIKQLVVNFAKRDKGYDIQKVLKGISFEIKKGEFFGIVGRNGSGKSTLLKLLAGIYSPDSGVVQVNGSLTPFIELGVGFNPELTGRENVFLNGALLGFSKKQMEEMYDDIVQFAELEKFMDQKLKNYSSGMQVRLAFSIAIRAESDILLLDEVLAVGDEAFQRKCFEYFEMLKKNKKTVIIVTHDMAAVERFCSKAMLVNEGCIEAIGDPFDISTKYTSLNQDISTSEQLKIDKKYPMLGKKSKILKIDKSNQTDDDLNVSIGFTTMLDDTVVSLAIVRNDNTYVGGFNTLNTLKIPKGDQSIMCKVPLSNLLKGKYFINISLYDKKFTLHDFKSHAVHFGKNETFHDKDGILNFNVSWLDEA